MQAVPVPHTVDFDIENAQLVIAEQLVDRLGVLELELFDSEIQMLRRLARDRAGVITELARRGFDVHEDTVNIIALALNEGS